MGTDRGQAVSLGKNSQCLRGVRSKVRRINVPSNSVLDERNEMRTQPKISRSTNQPIRASRRCPPGEHVLSLARSSGKTQDTASSPKERRWRPSGLRRGFSPGSRARARERAGRGLPSDLLGAQHGRQLLRFLDVPDLSRQIVATQCDAEQKPHPGHDPIAVSLRHCLIEFMPDCRFSAFYLSLVHL